MNVADYTESTSRFNFGQWQHVFVWEGKPFTMNEANNKRWEWIRARKEYREAFRLMALGCAPLESAIVSVHHLTSTRRAVDPCACVPSYKAALDGIVRAGVLPDDGPAYIKGVYFTAPVYAGRDALIVELTGDAA